MRLKSKNNKIKERDQVIKDLKNSLNSMEERYLTLRLANETKEELSSQRGQIAGLYEEINDVKVQIGSLHQDLIANKAYIQEVLNSIQISTKIEHSDILMRIELALSKLNVNQEVDKGK